MDFATLDKICDGHKAIAFAVSGGSDSLALMQYGAAWCRSSGRSGHVFTVDHGLRPESASEAKMMAKAAKALGLTHRTLVWKTPRKQQAAARNARLRLLSVAAHDIGSAILMTGHTLDDVAETIQIRAQRQPDSPYLAGPTAVSACPVWPEGRGIVMVRPLIATRRQALRTGLSATNATWIEDPSNQDARYERVRVRQNLQEAQLGAARDLQRVRADRDVRLGKLLASGDLIAVADTGLIRAQIKAIPDTYLAEVLSILIRVASGTDRMPDRAGLAAIANLAGRMTLGGAWLQRRGDMLEIGRDPGMAEKKEVNGLWDGRYERCDRSETPAEWPFILRESAPPGTGWREILSDRISHEALCLVLSGHAACELAPDQIGLAVARP